MQWDVTSPYIEIGIPAGSVAAWQVIKNPTVYGSISIRDHRACTQLLEETHVDVSDNFAVTASSRNKIGYFVLICYQSKVINSTDVRTSPTVVATFTNARILNVVTNWNEVGSPKLVNFAADSVAESEV